MKWQTVKSETLYEDSWQKVRLDTFKTPQGVEGTYVSLDKKQNGAVIIAQNAEGKLALVSIYRYPIDQSIWQFPVEGIERGEDEMQAAQRGAKEELDVWAESIEKIGEFFIDPGAVHQKSYVYLLSQLENMQHKVEKEALEQEMIKEIGWFSIEELNHMISEGSIRDGWTLSALHLLTIKNQQQALHDDL